jgi:hypothetical protein
MAEERKEGGDRKRFVAIGDDLEVDRMPVEPEGEERGDCVYGYHEEDADDTIEGLAAENERCGAKHTVSAPMVLCNVRRASILSRMIVESRSVCMLLI